MQSVIPTVKRSAADLSGVWALNITADHVGLLLQFLVAVFTIIYLYFQIIKIRRQLNANRLEDTSKMPLDTPSGMDD